MQLLESRIPLTVEGRKELALEAACLEQVRGQILGELEQATEGAEDRLQNELSAMDTQIERLHQVLLHGETVDNTSLVVAVGSEATLDDGSGTRTITVGGLLAANPGARCISFESSLARALLGRELGETVEVRNLEVPERLKIVGLRQGRPGAGLSQAASVG